MKVFSCHWNAFGTSARHSNSGIAVSVRFIPGSTIRWRERRFVVVDYAGLDAIVTREAGKPRLQRIPINEAVVDLTPGNCDAWTPDLVSLPEEKLANSREDSRKQNNYAL
jgi:hypothetical protein